MLQKQSSSNEGKSALPYWKESEEINNYSRHAYQILVRWYIFVITGNLLAFGWVFSLYNGGERPEFKYVLTVALIFGSINLIAIMVCIFVRRYFQETSNRLKKIEKAINLEYELNPSSDLEYVSPFPKKELVKTTIFMTISFFIVLVAWAAAVSIYYMIVS